MYLWTYAPSEDSDQPAHSHSLIRTLSGYILDSQEFKVSSCGQRRLKSVCAHAQTDLSLHWPHMSEGTFSVIAARMICIKNVNSPIDYWSGNLYKQGSFTCDTVPYLIPLPLLFHVFCIFFVFYIFYIFAYDVLVISYMLLKWHNFE